MNIYNMYVKVRVWRADTGQTERAFIFDASSKQLNDRNLLMECFYTIFFVHLLIKDKYFIHSLTL